MAYKLLQTDLGHKVFDWVVGEPQVCYLKTAQYDDTDELACDLTSRLTGCRSMLPVTQEGSNAHYVSFTVPASVGESEGFVFKVKKRATADDEWVTIATGAVHPRGPAIVGASGVL